MAEQIEIKAESVVTINQLEAEVNTAVEAAKTALGVFNEYLSILRTSMNLPAGKWLLTPDKKYFELYEEKSIVDPFSDKKVVLA